MPTRRLHRRASAQAPHALSARCSIKCRLRFSI
uniref:Uncharacterized protein n=1 Tax=Arundo donax TaxID=35708 RepID=A0A0A9D8C4_ARUDO